MTELQAQLEERAASVEELSSELHLHREMLVEAAVAYSSQEERGDRLQQLMEAGGEELAQQVRRRGGWGGWCS